MRVRSFLSVVLILALLSPGLGLAQAPNADGSHGPVTIQSQRHDVSAPLGNIPATVDVEPRAPGFQEIPRQPLPKRGPKPNVVDPVLQNSLGGLAMPSTTTNFEGVGNLNSVLPPDSNAAVGPSHVVQWVNLSLAMWDKSGNLLYGPVSGNTIWSGFGGPCQSTNNGDPIVLYDHLANRWVLSQFAMPNYPSGPFYQCIAVSTTGDPTGSYARYQFQISATKLNDYPKLAVWPDGYYMSMNQYTCSVISCSWAGAGVAVFERAPMLTGGTARMVYQDLAGVDINLGGMLPSSLDGAAPPAGTPNYFSQVDDDAWGYSPDQLQIWAFHADWNNTANATFTKVTTLPTAAFDSNMCGYSRNCIPQSGTSVKVDAISDRLMYRLQYRQFADHASVVVNHTVDVDGTDHAGVRWYELRNTGGAWSIYQQGTYAPDSNHRWMGSAAMDKDGNIALGYSVSSGSMFPSIRYTGRLSTDALGTLPQGESTLIAGAGAQTHSSGRWGDYSSMAVDPSDGCTFWYTQEYLPATSSAGWHTRLGSFKFASCGASTTPPAAPTLGATPGNAQVALSWSTSTGATSYNVLRGPSTGTETLLATGIGGTTYTDVGLTNGTTYFYEVQAVNSAGPSPNSNEVSATPTCPAIAAPTGVTPTAGNAQVSLIWNAVTGATGYNVKRSTTNGGPYTTVASPTSNSYTDTGLTNGTPYYYVVTASNGCNESAPSSQVSATPVSVSVPPAPTGLSASTGPGAKKITVSWNAVSGATSYTVQRATASAGPYTTITTTSATSVADVGLTSGKTYFYKVAASNSAGTGAFAGPVSATAK